MTTLVIWLGVDSRGPASIYIGSDSRITFTSNVTWDSARKVFACQRSADIVGYCGDVLFPSQVLGRITDLIDAEVLFKSDADAMIKHQAVWELVRSSFADYPSGVLANRSFIVVHCTRNCEGMRSSFHAAELAWSAATGWAECQLVLPAESGIVQTYGSGKSVIERKYALWNSTEERNTSRTVFSALCDAIDSEADSATGGAPQLTGLYRRGPGKSIGIIHRDARFLFGLRVEPSASLHLDAVEWRNDLFERYDWRSMQRISTAQPHRRPRKLGGA